MRRVRLLRANPTPSDPDTTLEKLLLIYGELRLRPAPPSIDDRRGMGEVYRAKDTWLDRTGAIEVLPSHLCDDSALKQRLEREAKAISALQHSNICTLYDIGLQDGTDLLVMEYGGEAPTSADARGRSCRSFPQFRTRFLPHVS